MQPTNNITKMDVEVCRKLGKYIMENAKWDGLSSKALMEVFQYMMWYNNLAKKLEDNVFEVTKIVTPPEEGKTDE